MSPACRRGAAARPRPPRRRSRTRLWWRPCAAAGAVITAKTTTTEYGWKTPGDCPPPASPAIRGTRRTRRAAPPPGPGRRRRPGFGPLHVGTDAGGSIRIPAAWCGVVGLKPSFGRVPQWPLGAFGPVAVAGPIARTVRDAALAALRTGRVRSARPVLAARAAARFPRRHRGRRGGPAHRHSAPSRALPPPVDADGLSALQTARDLLAGQGAVVEELNIALPDSSEYFRQALGRGAGPGGRQLAGGQTTRCWIPGFCEVAARYRNVSAQDFLEAEALRVEAAHAMAALEVDAILCPCVPHAAPLADAPAAGPGGGALPGLGALDVPVQSDPPTGHLPADGGERCRVAAGGADCRTPLS